MTFRYLNALENTMNMCNMLVGDQRSNDNGLGFRNAQRNPFSGVVSFTTNSTRTVQELNLTICSKKPFNEQWHSQSQTYYSDTCFNKACTLRNPVL